MRWAGGGAREISAAVPALAGWQELGWLIIGYPAGATGFDNSFENVGNSSSKFSFVDKKPLSIA